MADLNLKLVRELLQSQRTMTLATADPEPWSAPVYFVYLRQRLYFFSSPSSRHIIAADKSGHGAASIFRDGDSWRHIEGLQMDGTIERISLGAEALAAYGGYLQKFPSVKDFFVGTEFDFDQFLKRFRTQLYTFLPRQVFYLNNKAGLGKRQAIPWPA